MVFKRHNPGCNCCVCVACTILNGQAKDTYTLRLDMQRWSTSSVAAAPEVCERDCTGDPVGDLLNNTFYLEPLPIRPEYGFSLSGLNYVASIGDAGLTFPDAISDANSCIFWIDLRSHDLCLSTRAVLVLVIQTFEGGQYLLLELLGHDDNDPVDDSDLAGLLSGGKTLYRSFQQLLPAAGGEIIDATNASPIVIEVGVGDHVPPTGTIVEIQFISGNTAANGEFTITRIDATHMELDSSTGNGTYAFGGDWRVATPIGGDIESIDGSSDSSVPSQPIIEVPGHPLLDNDRVTLQGITGRLAHLNGSWYVSRVDEDHFFVFGRNGPISESDQYDSEGETRGPNGARWITIGPKSGNIIDVEGGEQIPPVFSWSGGSTPSVTWTIQHFIPSYLGGTRIIGSLDGAAIHAIWQAELGTANGDPGDAVDNEDGTTTYTIYGVEGNFDPIDLDDIIFNVEHEWVTIVTEDDHFMVEGEGVTLDVEGDGGLGDLDGDFVVGTVESQRRFRLAPIPVDGGFYYGPLDGGPYSGTFEWTEGINATGDPAGEAVLEVDRASLLTQVVLTRLDLPAGLWVRICGGDSDFNIQGDWQITPVVGLAYTLDGSTAPSPPTANSGTWTCSGSSGLEERLNCSEFSDLPISMHVFNGRYLPGPPNPLEQPDYPPIRGSNLILRLSAGSVE